MDTEIFHSDQRADQDGAHRGRTGHCQQGWEMLRRPRLALVLTTASFALTLKLEMFFRGWRFPCCCRS